MASKHKNREWWHVSFYFGEKRFKGSLKTKDEKTADLKCAEIEQTIQLLESGRIHLPSDLTTNKDITEFIIGGGKTKPKTKIQQNVSMKDACDIFQKNILHNAETTRGTIKTHCNHLTRLIKKKFTDLKIQDLRNYAHKRLKEKTSRGNINPKTVHKELVTFDALWLYGVEKKWVNGVSPAKSVELPKSDEALPFKTWNEIEEIIKRGKLDEEEQRQYWECLFLDSKQVNELVKYVEKIGEPYMIAAIAIAAYTGARRSEIFRSRIEDWDFKRGILHLRGRKDSRKVNISLREVNIHPNLKRIMNDWFNNHYAGGILTISLLNQDNKPTPLSKDQTHSHFKKTLKDSKWSVLKGWHTLRHSFCSNAARLGVPDSIIDGWMGHNGDEAIKKRYRHLFPSDKEKFMDQLF